MDKYLVEGRPGDPENEYDKLYKEMMADFKYMVKQLKDNRKRFKKANDKWSFVNQLEEANDVLWEIHL